MVTEFNGFTKGVIGRKLPSDNTLSKMRKIELIKLLHLAQHNYDVLMEFYLNAVKYSESVEFVPVVRCKECQYWEKETGWCDKHSHFIDSIGNACHPWESSNWKMYNENDFCSDGERGKDECVCKKERH